MRFSGSGYKCPFKLIQHVFKFVAQLVGLAGLPFSQGGFNICLESCCLKNTGAKGLAACLRPRQKLQSIIQRPHHVKNTVLFVLVLLLSYALCSLQVDRSTQAILADKNRFLLSKIDTMQIRLQDWRRTMLEQTNTLALSESVRLFAADMAALPSDLLDNSSRTAAPGSDSDQLSLQDQREHMQQLLADIAYQNDLDRIRMFLPGGRKIVDS